MENERLCAAKKAKNDEFYTQYVDIEAEMNAYLAFNPGVFRDKIVLLPCADPEWSNFTKYFAQNFERLGLLYFVKTANIAGVPLNEQELRNAIHSGPFVTKAKEEFSNSQNARVQVWSAYVKGTVNRQDFLEEALNWVSHGEIDAYMSQHRFDADITELKTYFETVLAWVQSVFPDVHDEMQGLAWGMLYERHHKMPYDAAKLAVRVRDLIADEQVENNRGIWEFLLGGEQETRLLHVRVFDEKTKAKVYAKQTALAEGKGMSNCPLCAQGAGPNAKRIYKRVEMDADHVTAWSRGGVTTERNCQMLCRTCNRAKGNR